jgi:hypothetical protein
VTRTIVYYRTNVNIQPALVEKGLELVVGCRGFGTELKDEKRFEGHGLKTACNLSG